MSEPNYSAVVIPFVQPIEGTERLTIELAVARAVVCAVARAVVCAHGDPYCMADTQPEQEPDALANPEPNEEAERKADVFPLCKPFDDP